MQLPVNSDFKYIVSRMQGEYLLSKRTNWFVMFKCTTIRKPFGLVGLWSLYRGLFIKFLSFWLYGDCRKWEGWAQVNHTGWMTVVAPADRPESVRNSCVIERICSVFVLFHLCIVCRLEVFVIRLRQISSFFSWWVREFFS